MGKFSLTVNSNIFFKKTMTTTNIDLCEMVRDARREAEREQERLQERMETQQAVVNALSLCDSVVAENEELKDDRARLEAQVQERDEKISRLETQLGEMNKLASGVAKKSSPDDVAKALRIYLNTSKRKTLSKREAAKTVLLELIAAAKLELPE